MRKNDLNITEDDKLEIGCNLFIKIEDKTWEFEKEAKTCGVKKVDGVWQHYYLNDGDNTVFSTKVSDNNKYGNIFKKGKWKYFYTDTKGNKRFFVINGTDEFDKILVQKYNRIRKPVLGKVVIEGKEVEFDERLEKVRK